MSSASQVIQRHLDAIWNRDFLSAGDYVAKDAETCVVSADGSFTIEERNLYKLYGFVTVEWDYRPSKVVLTEAAEGTEVVADINLTNGSFGWAKRVRAEYALNANRIVKIVLIDGAGFEVNNG